MEAQPIASVLSEMPGPALPVTARYPEKEKPSASETAPSSSSAWTKMPPYFGSSRPQDLHDRRPGRDRITGAVTHPGGDQAVGERLVAIHRDLRAVAFFVNGRLKFVLLRQDIADGVGVAGGKRHDGGVGDARVFAGKFFFDQGRQLLDIEVKDFRDQPEDEDVFALVLRRSAERFDRQSGDGHADVNETFVVQIGLDVVGVVEEDAAVFQKADVVLVTVLIKRDEEVGFIARGEDFARAHADLENRGTAGDGRGDRHVGHDIVIAASGQAREESAGALDAVLRISREADNGVVDALGAKIGAIRLRCRSGRWGSGGRRRGSGRGPRRGWIFLAIRRVSSWCFGGFFHSASTLSGRKKMSNAE